MITAPTSAQELPRDTAWQRLREGVEGRLHHQTGCGPRHAVLPYAVTRDGIWLRVPDFAGVAHSAPGTDVTFEVSGTMEDGTGWVVWVSGAASLESLRSHPDIELTLPSGLWCRWIFVPATSVEAYRYRVQPSLAALGAVAPVPELVAVGPVAS